MFTCKTIHSDQKQLLPNRNRHPNSQLSLPGLKKDFVGNNSVFNSLGPLSNAMAMAPLTQITVPRILEIVLRLRILTFSNLIHL